MNEVVRMVALAYIMEVLLCNCFFTTSLFFVFFTNFHTGVYAKINGLDHYALQVQTSVIRTIQCAAKTLDVFHF